MKANQLKPEDTKFARLRADAEKALSAAGLKTDIYEGKDIAVIFQELQVYQMELELQNDELRIANEDLELQRLRFAGIYDLAPIGYFILDKLGTVEEVNTAGIQLLETSRGSLVGRSLQQFVAGEFTDTYYLFFHHLRKSGTRHSCQLKLTSKSGRNFYAQLEGFGIKKTLQSYIAVIDVTEAIDFRQKLARSNDQLEMAMKASHAGTWELHTATMSFYLDKYNYDLCNIREDEFDGTYSSFIGLIHPNDRFMVDQHFRTAVNSNTEIHVECRFIHFDDSICYANIRGHQIEKPDGTKSIVGIIMDITDKKRIEAKAAQLQHDRQKAISIAMLNAEESERKRISEALHDSVSQLLYGIKIHLNQLDDSNQAHGIKQVHQLLDTAIQETRNISFELMPAILPDFGLAAALDELIRRLSAPNFKIKYQISGFSKHSDPLLETCIFRTVQELINNCMKHSGANLVNIKVKKDKKIVIEVIDNGRGFDTMQLEKKPKGTGLSSIRNRIGLYNGHLQIKSAPGNGTAVKIELCHG